MSNIAQIKLISIDLFRTLVPLPHTQEFIRRWYLDGKYPEDVARKIADRVERILGRRWDEAGNDGAPFTSVRGILEDTLRELQAEIDVGLDVEAVTDRIMAQHKPRPLFEDARPFLQATGGRYPICLSSDCDLPMLEGIDQVYPFDKIFTSEDLRTYKLNTRFFQSICDHYGYRPSEIMHVGDSRSDVVAPQRLGVVTCWLNRKNRKWDQSPRPDFEVRSLLEVLQILGL